MPTLTNILERILTGDETKLTQEILNTNTPELFRQAGSTEIVNHTIQVYDKTADYYNCNPHTQQIIPELISFMGLIESNSLVLDLGCGHGRDTQYLSSRQKREDVTPNGLNIPDREFQVVAYDGSKKLLKKTLEKVDADLKNIRAVIQGDFTRPYADEKVIHYLKTKNDFNDLSLARFGLGQSVRELFDGIWACTSLLVHTPLERIDSAVAYWGKTLRIGGIFAVSYFTEQGQPKQENLRLSKANEIKPFIRPSQEQVLSAFKQAGMSKLTETKADLVDGEIKIPAFYISEMYVKEK